MKKNILLTMLGLLIVLAACDPIEDRDVAGPIVRGEDFDISITQDPENDYILYLENRTPKVFFVWDYVWGTTSKQKDTVYMSVPGTYTIKVLGTTAGGLQEGEKEITVTKENPNAFVEPEWGMLTNFREGKTWVWAVDNTYTDEKRIWGNGGTADGRPAWWGRTAADAAAEGINLESKMIFDLDGGKNFTKIEYNSSGAEVITRGTFDILFDQHESPAGYARLVLRNATVLHGISQNDGKKVVYDFDIMKLTEDELLLNRITESAEWEAWHWMFKREGYTY